MKKLSLVFASLALLSSGAFAADLPVAPATPAYKVPAMVPAPVYSWTGCYVDGGAGYALWTQDHYGESYPGLVSSTGSSTAGGRGWYGQAGGGCDYQFSLGGLGNFIIGVLGDYDFASIKGNFESSFATTSALEKQTNTWVAGGRVGFLITPSFLTYISGGYTEAKFDAINFGTFGLPANTYKGWFLGGGSETSLSTWLPTGFFLRSEYRYSSFSATDLPYSGAGIGLAENSKKYEQMLGTELIYRFSFQ